MHITTAKSSSRSSNSSILYDILESPIGALTVGTDGSHITELHIEGDRYFTGPSEHWIKNPTHPLLRQARLELEEYFMSKRKHFDLPLTHQGTPFQSSVWAALQKIPFGSTTNYSAIAATIGKPKAVRAVGTAIGRNPLCIIVACHRVLTNKGELGGYVAGLERKQQLLAMENIS